MKKIFFILSSVFCIAYLAGATPVYTASFSEKAPLLDGKINDKVWEKVPWSTPFRTRVNNKEPKAPTFFKIIYTKDALYIGVKCIEKKLTEMKKENNYTEFWLYDVIEVFLLPFENEMQHFICSVAGSMNEEIPVKTSARTKRQTAWKAVAAKDGKENWSVEFCIPLYLVGKAPCKGEKIVFPINICRNSTPAKELSSWSFQKGSFKVKSGFGRLILLPPPAGARNAVSNALRQPHAISLEKRWQEIRKDPSWQYLLSREKILVKKLDLLCSSFENVTLNAAEIHETIRELEKKRGDARKAHEKAIMKMLFEE